MLPKRMCRKQAVFIGERETPRVRAPNLTAAVNVQDTGPGAGPPIHCLSTRAHWNLFFLNRGKTTAPADGLPREPGVSSIPIHPT